MAQPITSTEVNYKKIKYTDLKKICYEEWLKIPMNHWKSLNHYTKKCLKSVEINKVLIYNFLNVRHFLHLIFFLIPQVICTYY